MTQRHGCWEMCLPIGLFCTQEKKVRFSTKGFKGFFNTPNWFPHPEKTFTKRLKRDFFHNWFGGLPRGVLYGCVETTFDCCGCGCGGSCSCRSSCRIFPQFSRTEPENAGFRIGISFFEEFIFSFFGEDLGNQWIFLVIGGRDYITPLMAIYHIYIYIWYISSI